LASASARAEVPASFGETSPEPPDIPSREGGPAEPASAFSASVDEWLTRTEVNPKLGIPRDPFEIPRDAFPAETSATPASARGAERSRGARSVSTRRERNTDHTRTYMQKLGRRWGARAAIAAGVLVGFNLVVASASYLPADIATGSVELPALSEAPALILPTLTVPAPPELDFRQATVQPEPELDGRFHVAVGLFVTEERASRLVAELTEAGFLAFQRTVRMNNERVMQQVLLGPYSERTRAEAALEQLRQKGGFDDANVIELQPTTGTAAY
jgi:cell division septation protein DedD